MPHPRLSLLAPIVPPATCLPASSGAPPASTGVGGAVARLRSVSTEPRAPTSVAHASGARTLPLGVGSHSQAGINWPWPLPPPMLQIYVSSVSDVIRNMLQVFDMDVAKVYRDVASVSEACCKCLFKMFHLLQRYVLSVFDLDVAHVSHICCKSMSKMSQLF
jgi:hypothetical protein